eukprot:753986-Hanusia_phi.AAC.9
MACARSTTNSSHTSREEAGGLTAQPPVISRVTRSAKKTPRAATSGDTIKAFESLPSIQSDLMQEGYCFRVPATLEGSLVEFAFKEEMKKRQGERRSIKTSEELSLRVNKFMKKSDLEEDDIEHFKRLTLDMALDAEERGNGVDLRESILQEQEGESSAGASRSSSKKNESKSVRRNLLENMDQVQTTGNSKVDSGKENHQHLKGQGGRKRREKLQTSIEEREDEIQSTGIEEREDENQSTSIEEREDENQSSSIEEREDENQSTGIEEREDENQSSSIEEREDEIQSSSIEEREDEIQSSSIEEREDENQSTSIEEREGENQSTSIEEREDENQSTSIEEREDENQSTSVGEEEEGNLKRTKRKRKSSSLDETHAGDVEQQRSKKKVCDHHQCSRRTPQHSDDAGSSLTTCSLEQKTLECLKRIFLLYNPNRAPMSKHKRLQIIGLYAEFVDFLLKTSVKLLEVVNATEQPRRSDQPPAQEKDSTCHMPMRCCWLCWLFDDVSSADRAEASE